LFRSIDPDQRWRARGFTMVEALIALAVIAVSLAAIASVIAENIRSTEVVEARLGLVQAARALLTALPDRNQLGQGELRGELGSERWRIDVLPFAADFVDPGQPTPWVPQTVVLRLQAPSGEIIRVDTVRLRRNVGSGR
jgi:general secretion pathway protein I